MAPADQRILRDRRKREISCRPLRYLVRTDIHRYRAAPANDSNHPRDTLRNEYFILLAIAAHIHINVKLTIIAGETESNEEHEEEQQTYDISAASLQLWTVKLRIMRIFFACNKSTKR